MHQFHEVEMVGDYRPDLAATDGSVAITVELKQGSNGLVCDWWVSGFNERGDLLVLARATFPIGQPRPQGLQEADWRVLYERWVGPLVSMSREYGGLETVPNGPEVLSKKRLVMNHLKIHEDLGNLGGAIDDPRLKVAREYQLIKSFGFKAAIPLIAEREGLKKSTVIRRIDVAKAEGLLPKGEQPENFRGD